MALNNYDELKQSVAEWMHRTDLAAYIPDFIRLAELDLERENLPLPELDVSTTLTFTAGKAPKPGDFKAVRALWYVDSTSGERSALRTAPVEDVMTMYPYPNTTTLRPRYYTILGNEFVVVPIPDDGTTMNLDYVKTPTPLGIGNQTNEWLQVAPDALLFGALSAARFYGLDDQRSELYRQRYNDAVARLKERLRTQMFETSELRAQPNLVSTP